MANSGANSNGCQVPFWKNHEKMATPNGGFAMVEIRGRFCNGRSHGKSYMNVTWDVTMPWKYGLTFRKLNRHWSRSIPWFIIQTLARQKFSGLITAIGCWSITVHLLALCASMLCVFRGQIRSVFDCCSRIRKTWLPKPKTCWKLGCNLWNWIVETGCNKLTGQKIADKWNWVVTRPCCDWFPYRKWLLCVFSFLHRGLTPPD